MRLVPNVWPFVAMPKAGALATEMPVLLGKPGLFGKKRQTGPV
jgi:hypothetical protein